MKLKSSSQQAAWDDFYQHHHRGEFFKDRKYLPMEFPELLETAKGDGQPYTLIEFGCGYGCSILPVVARNSTIRCVGCDMSGEALAIFASRAQYQEHASRLTLVQHDAVHGPPLLPLVPYCADLLLMTFFLSAIAPEHHASVMARAWDVLQPGGLLLFRDYGLFDKSQMKSTKRVGPNLHVRPDGTLAYFFSKEGVAKLVSGEGWELLECRYATVEQVNRKTGAVIRRVFVHTKARKRGGTASSQAVRVEATEGNPTAR